MFICRSGYQPSWQVHQPKRSTSPTTGRSGYNAQDTARRDER